MKREPEIAIILGTRAELIKTFPIMLEFKKRGIPYVFIHTGQHNLKDLCEKFSVKTPEVVLTKEPTKSSKFHGKQIKGIFWNLALVFRIKKELKKHKKLKYVIYHGDTMTTSSASIASSKLLNPRKKYKNVHLEAGLRSWNNFEPFPEEISRRVAGKFSDILFAVSSQAEQNLIRFKNKKIILVGNTILDSAHVALEVAKKKKIRPLNKNRFALITIHRHENLKNKNRLEKIVEILCSIDIPAYFAIHDNTKEKLEKFNLLKKLENKKKIHLIEPMDYVSFIYQMSKCSLIICDGGSMQEESLIFGKPCVILRKATERPEGLKTNFQYLSGLDVEKTKRKIEEYLNPKFKLKKFDNPYGQIGVSSRIAGVLK